MLSFYIFTANPFIRYIFELLLPILKAENKAHVYEYTDCNLNLSNLRLLNLLLEFMVGIICK